MLSAGPHPELQVAPVWAEARKLFRRRRPSSRAASCAGPENGLCDGPKCITGKWFGGFNCLSVMLLTSALTNHIYIYVLLRLRLSVAIRYHLAPKLDYFMETRGSWWSCDILQSWSTNWTDCQFWDLDSWNWLGTRVLCISGVLISFQKKRNCLGNWFSKSSWLRRPERSNEATEPKVSFWPVQGQTKRWRKIRKQHKFRCLPPCWPPPWLPNDVCCCVVAL